MSLAVNSTPTHPLLPKLKQLKLSGMLGTLEVRARQAAEENLSAAEFLALLVDDELERRNQRRLRCRLLEAGCQEGKTLARFNFAAVPTLNRAQVVELATCGFVERQQNLLICGPTGVGKSHLAAALSYEAVKRGYRVLMRPVHQLLADLHAARADGGYSRRLLKLCAVDLLVLDDFGLRPLPVPAIDDLYEIISQRYEQRSLVITSNRALEEWPEIFGDGLLASAAMDRLTHHAQTLIIRGASYRQLERRKEVEQTESSDAKSE
ncbi:MAG: IS21-like element helper ATPase IstB [Chloroflexi bacterium]|nr:IS21-like element helper ATPase IstB [Bacteroidota bacterium]MCL5109863.1 IS21-like element helper ATPase IstB [Chloroflexota bacterium]